MRSAASDPGQHCLKMYFLWDARLKRVNLNKQKQNWKKKKKKKEEEKKRK